MPMKGMIAAVNPDGVIGLNGDIPWHYKGDFARFKRVTMGSTIIMGRATWESMGKKPLPGRRNVVISSRPVPGVEHYPSIDAALAAIGGEGDIWFVGGTRIYEEAMKHADVIDLTYVPDRLSAEDTARAATFPPIDEAVFEPGPIEPFEGEPSLTRRCYTRAVQKG